MAVKYDERDHARFTAIHRTLAKHGGPTVMCLADLARQPELGERPWTLQRLTEEMGTPRFGAWLKDFQQVMVMAGEFHAFETWGKLSQQPSEQQMRATLVVVGRRLTAERRAREEREKDQAQRERTEAKRRPESVMDVLTPDGRRVAETTPNAEAAAELELFMRLKDPNA